MPDQINPLGKPVFADLPVAFQQHYSQLTDTVNSLAGHNGKIPLANHVDLGGKQLRNIGAPSGPTDALASGIAESKYSVGALAPQLESNAKTGLKSMRRINDTSQREQSSSYLNDLPSTAVNANEIYPTIANSGTSLTATIPPSLFTYADGTTIKLISRTDTFGLPSQFAISSISSSGNVVTVVTTLPTGLTAGQAVTIDDVTPNDFNGTWVVTSATGSTLTYQASLGTLTGSGGFAQTNGVYYYYVNKRNPTVHLAGPFPADTMQNRIQVCQDGSQIVAVIVITAGGGQVSQSGGGGSPMTGIPTAGALFALLVGAAATLKVLVSALALYN